MIKMFMMLYINSLLNSKNIKKLFKIKSFFAICADKLKGMFLDVKGAASKKIALFEAKAAGKRAISLKVAKINNSLSRAMSDAGIEITGADTESIFSRLTEDSLVKADIKKFSGSIRNCVNVIMKELSFN